MGEPLRIDANAVIDRMREVLEVSTDIALCAALNRGSTVAASWRHRNSVPYDDVTGIALRKGVSLDWLVLGDGPRLRGALSGVTESPAPAYIDPRIARMLRFISTWPIGRDSDDVAWLERTLARNVQEYGQWLASQTTDASPSTVEGQDKPDP